MTTFHPNIKTVKFDIMYQERSTHRYTTQKAIKDDREQKVLDQLDLTEIDD